MDNTEGRIHLAQISNVYWKAFDSHDLLVSNAPIDAPWNAIAGENGERGLEEERPERLRSLERLVCELLIKNQRLRMSLALAMTPER